MQSKVLIIVFIFFIKTIQAQQHIPSKMKNDIADLIENVKLKNDLSDFLIYNIGNNFLLINKNKEKYDYWLFKKSFNYSSQKNIYQILKEKKNFKEDLLNKLFSSKYCREYPFDDTGQEYIYYIKFLENQKKCEFFIPYYGYRKNIKIKKPIKKRYLMYLTKEVMNL